MIYLRIATIHYNFGSPGSIVVLDLGIPNLDDLMSMPEYDSFLIIRTTCSCKRVF
jgi:hypothetical protein